MLDIKFLRSIDAEKIYKSWFRGDIFKAEPKESLLTQDEKQLRCDLLNIYTEVQKNIKGQIILENNNKYIFDLAFGLKLYEYFSIGKHKDDYPLSLMGYGDFWRRINCCIVPDVIFDRHGAGEDYYYKKDERLGLARLWWYIHLSWQGDEELTFNTLKNFSTDMIVAMVERKSHIDLDFTRAYVRVMSEISNKVSKVKLQETFRKTQKLHTAKKYAIEPSLFSGGYEGYVKKLLDEAMGEYKE